MGKLILTTLIIALTAIGLSGCVAYPNYGYRSPYCYQNRSSWGYQNYGNNQGYRDNGYHSDGNHERQ